jgi:hypothetical protein
MACAQRRPAKSSITTPAFGEHSASANANTAADSSR